MKLMYLLTDPAASAEGEGAVLRVVRPDIRIGRCPKETATPVKSNICEAQAQ
jgi:hypothetical protein